MWGDLALLKFYPRNWQSAMTRSQHPWILHTTIWHYWLWFTFITVLNLYFVYIYKTISYQRADIRGTRSTGEKRRLAWPEMLIVIIPFYWAINIVTNALAFLRVIESSCSFVTLTVQVNAFQWGWKYCYNDLFYMKNFFNPALVGKDSQLSVDGTTEFVNRNYDWNLENRVVFEEYQISYVIDGEKFTRYRIYETPEETLIKRWDWDIRKEDDSDITIENYFCRNWLKNFGNIENEYSNKTFNKKWQNGFWQTSQGLDQNSINYSEKLNQKKDKLIYNDLKDPLRLLRSSGSLVLPTKNTIRLMACSDDITHSWAVPSLGFKMDCVPGRIFCLYLNIAREGVYFGQCSELCGWNHYNMPIVLFAMPLEHYIIWWELELHNFFFKKDFDFKKDYSNNDLDYVTYKLINYKYK